MKDNTCQLTFDWGDYALWTEYTELNKEMKLVEEFIRKSVSSRNKLLSTIVNELIAAGGKRLRPAFVLMSAKFGKTDSKKIIRAAGALEILHTATLVHDDIIDRSEFRRGKITVSEKYGNEMAIYVGDFLFTKAVLMLSNGIPTEKLEIVARTIKVICEGEVDQYQDKFNVNTTSFSYLKRVSRKTAVLFGATCGLGASLAKCQVQIGKDLARFGLYYGMAFQIKDDLHDFLSDAGSVGKPVENDLVKGVVTLPVIYAKRKSVELAKLLSKALNKKDGLSPSDFKNVYTLVAENGGIEKTEIMLQRYIDRGLKILERLPENEYRDLFRKLIMELKS